MMSYQKLNWILMLLLVPILILGLTACGDQDKNEAETGEEKAAEQSEANAPVRTEETTAAGEPDEAIEVRQATTVMAATRMIDLHNLPLPDGAELMGQPESGSLSYQAPIKVAEAVELYRSALVDQGWQEEVEAGHVESASAALFFTKEDFKLSVSVGDMGEGRAMVSLTNHGNIDLRALPQMADAEELFNSPGSLGYVSSSDVADVTDFTRRELAAQNWHEYSRPHTTIADDPEQQSLTLIQNGLELSAYISVAPAQGGKTSVQYGVSVLPLDLPVPADATGLEFEKMLLNLSLSYTTPADFETLFDYYSREMTDLGWVVIDSIGMMTPERATLFFGNENVPPHTLVLDLVPSDGQTMATLRDYEADELTELNAPGDGDLVETTGDDTTTGDDSAVVEANVGDTVELGDLSLVVNEVISEESAFEPDEGNKFLMIVFTIENRHPSDSLSAFSLLWLSINGPDGTSYGYDGMGFMAVDAPDDSYGTHNGNVAPGEQARGKITFQVPVDAKELVFVLGAPELGADDVFVALPETEAPQMAGSAGGEIPAFLTPADAQDVVYDADLAEIAYTSPSDVETVIEFYRQSLAGEGWQEDETFSTVDETFALVMFNRGADSFNVNVFSMGTTEVTVDISFAPSLAEMIEGGTSTGTEPTAGDSGPLSLVEEEGFPVPSDFEYLSTMEGPFAVIVTFGSPSEVDTLAELYQTELPGQGWEFIEHSLNGDMARLYFENSEQKLSIDLRVNDGEISPDLAGQTSVELNVKDPVAAAEAGVLPPPDHAKILLINSAAVDLTANINQQEFELAPVPLSTEFPEDLPSIDLPPGQYSITTTAPDGSVTSHDIEIGLDKDIAPGEAWALILDVGMSPMEWPAY